MTLGGVVLFVGVTLAAAQEPKLVVNEAMANEPGSTTSLEWVEVLNWPDTGNGVVNLSGYWLYSRGDTTVFDTNVLVPPGGFVILASKPVGPSSFEEYWGDNTGVWGDGANETFPVVQATLTLLNQLDYVRLFSPQGDTSAFGWAIDPGDGISIERVHPNRYTELDNVMPCVDPSGSTPGRPNSVLASPNMLAIPFASMVPEADWGTPIECLVDVRNVGLGRSTAATVSMLEDMAPTIPEFLPVGITEAAVAPLDEGEAAFFNLTWSDPPPGRHRVRWAVHRDGDTLNQTDPRILIIHHSQPLIIVSEFLANPEDGPGEWIEISNRADFPIDMTSVRIGDERSFGTLPPMSGKIPSGAYWVLAQDEFAFRSFYPDFDGIVLEIIGWQTLNNDGDLIRLIGADGEIIDSTRYTTVYNGNRSVERMTLTPTFAAAKDWVASVDPSGATPGRANSVNRELAGALHVSVSPNPMYLSRAGVAKIEYRLEIGAQLTLKIFDRSGQLVKTIADETSAATGSVTWDGTDDGGVAVHPGAYVLLARSDPGGDVVKTVIVVGP